MRHIYVVVRGDLPFCHQTVQACHAGIAVAREGLILKDEEHPSLVVLTVPDEEALLDVADRLHYAKIPFRLFQEADMGNESTALATGPLEKADRKLFQGYKLLQGAA